MIPRYIHRVLHSSSLYPLGTFWLAAMVIVPSIVAGWIDLGHGMVAITLAAGSLILVTDRRDTQRLRAVDVIETHKLAERVDEVHDLVNSTNDNLQDRINQLTVALQEGNVEVPKPKQREDADDQQ